MPSSPLLFIVGAAIFTAGGAAGTVVDIDDMIGESETAASPEWFDIELSDGTELIVDDQLNAFSPNDPGSNVVCGVVQSDGNLVSDDPDRDQLLLALGGSNGNLGRLGGIITAADGSDAGNGNNADVDADVNAGNNNDVNAGNNNDVNAGNERSEILAAVDGSLLRLDDVIDDMDMDMDMDLDDVLPQIEDRAEGRLMAIVNRTDGRLLGIVDESNGRLLAVVNRANGRLQQVTDTADGRVHRVVEHTKGRLLVVRQGIVRRIQNGIDATGDRVDGIRDDKADRVGEAQDTVGTKVDTVRDQSTGLVDQARDEVDTRVRQAQDDVADKVEVPAVNVPAVNVPTVDVDDVTIDPGSIDVDAGADGSAGVSITSEDVVVDLGGNGNLIGTDDGNDGIVTTDGLGLLGD